MCCYVIREFENKEINQSIYILQARKLCSVINATAVTTANVLILNLRTL